MPTVEFAVEDGIAQIRLNRPERLNAVAAVLVDDFLAALDAAARSDARVVVLSGERPGLLRRPRPQGTHPRG